MIADVDRQRLQCRQMGGREHPLPLSTLIPIKAYLLSEREWRDFL